MADMTTYVAFLRALNVGGRRLTNEQLCSHVADLGFANVSSYRASGNVIFQSEEARQDIEASLEVGLAAALDYDVPAMVRSLPDLRSLIEAVPFSNTDLTGIGKPQVVFLKDPITIGLSRFATEVDALVADYHDIFWLPVDGISNTRLDVRAFDEAVGTNTVRTVGTLEGIVKKVGARG